MWVEWARWRFGIGCGGGLCVFVGGVECCCWRKTSSQQYGRVLVSQIRLLDFLVQKLKGQLIWRETANPVFLDYMLLIDPRGRSVFDI